MGKRTKVSSNESVGARDRGGFGSRVQQSAGADGLVLMALGACTATDVVIVLRKKRQKLESLEVICSGERASEPPTVWTKLEILYRLRGELDESAVKHAIELSEEKYCSVSAMLKKTAKVSWRYLTGTYNIGSDNRGAFTINTASGPPPLRNSPARGSSSNVANRIICDPDEGEPAIFKLPSG